MGQKVNPYILRIGIHKTWASRWYARKRDYAEFINEDVKIRKMIKERFLQAAINRIIIERLSARLHITIATARPGVIIGRHRQDIDRLRQDISALCKREVHIDTEEINNPFAHAQLVAENVAFQLEKRVAFRRAAKRAIEQSMNAGAKGIRIGMSGRLGGAEMSRSERYKEGKIPLQTLRADIDYGFAEAFTTYGTIGVKVWVYRGDVAPQKTLVAQVKAAPAQEEEKTEAA